MRLSVNRRNIEALAHIAVWARASLFRRFMDTNVYGTGPVKVRKTRHNIFVDIRIFFYGLDLIICSVLCLCVYMLIWNC